MRRYGFDVRDETVCLFPFDEVADTVWPVDMLEHSKALQGDDGNSIFLPAIVEAERGRARAFGDATIGQAAEEVAGSLQLRRNCSIRAAFRYSIADASNGEIATVVQRGAGTGSDTQRRLYGLEVKRVSATSITLRMRWDDYNGSSYDDTVVESDSLPYTGDEVVVVAVREWVSQSLAYVYFYVGGELASGPHTETAAFIREGSGGPLLVGSMGILESRYWPDNSYIAEIAIDGDAISAEEVRQEYRRMLVHQPAGATVVRNNLPPGSSYNQLASSLVQKLIAAEGDAIGHLLALGAQMSEDWLPDRAYGQHLEHWERVLKVASRADDTSAQRRAVCVAAMRKELGFALEDIKTALSPLLDVDTKDIEIVEFTGLRTDDFSTDDITTPPSSLWSTKAGAGTITIEAGPLLRLAINSGENARWYNGGAPRREVALAANLGEDVDGATMMSTVVRTSPASPGNNQDVIYGHFWRDVVGNAVIIGKQWNQADSYEHVVGYEVSLDDGIAATLFDVDPGSSGFDHILTRYDTAGQMYYEYASTLGGLLGYGGTSQAANLSSPRWAGLCIVGLDSSTSAAWDIDFTDFRLFEPKSPRGHVAIVYRDPSDPGTPKIDQAQVQVDRQGPAHGLIQVATHKQGMLAGTGRAGKDPAFPTLT